MDITRVRLAENRPRNPSGVLGSRFSNTNRHPDYLDFLSGKGDIVILKNRFLTSVPAESPNVKPGFGDPPADDRVIQEMPTSAPLQASSEDTIWRSAISLGISRPSCGPQLRPESTAAPPENGESRSSVSHAYLMVVLGKARLALCMIRIPARTTRMRCSTTI